jgi:hypothetical protein
VNSSDGRTAGNGLRGWWQTPPRSGMQRLIVPYEYRHLRGYGLLRIAGGSVALAAGAVCLSCDADAWAAFFLVVGALNLAGGCWYVTIARSAAAAT